MCGSGMCGSSMCGSDIIQSFVCHDSFTHVRHDSFIYLYMCDMTDSNTASTYCDTRAFSVASDMWDMTHSYMCNMTHSYMCDMTHSYMCDMTHSYMCDMTHSYLCDVTHSNIHTGATWLIPSPPLHMPTRAQFLWPHICETRLIHTCATWLIYTCATWLIYTCATWLIHILTHVRHDSIPQPICRHVRTFCSLTFVRHVTSIHVRHDSFIYLRDMTYSYMCEMTHSYIYECATWLIHIFTYVQRDSFIYLYRCDMP